MPIKAVSRRGILMGTAGAAASALSGLPVAAASQAQSQTSSNGDTVLAGKDLAVATTESGKVAGYVARGIFAFKGIPYAAPPVGPMRFMPPRKPAPWSGIRSSRQFGPICPQDQGLGGFHDEESFIFRWNNAVQSEDCLRINVWTPGIRDNARRPVMVWLHGGGFEAGSGHDLPAFDGENLARRGDVVVVTLNHRLNLLGYLDLSAYGSQYADSGNVGMLDIVAALEWVRDNIAEFGGDPGQVMIFGQSGGGAKVTTLLAMPSARGLFHRAAVHSGSFPLTNSPEKSRRFAAMLLAELGLSGNDVGRLAELPFATLQRAGDSVMKRVNGDFELANFKSLASRLLYAPVADGRIVPEVPFGTAAPAVSKDVPLLVGTTLNEVVTAMDHPEYLLMTRDEALAKVANFYPGRAAQIMAVFERATPTASPFALWSRIATAQIRAPAIRQASLKSALGAAPAYLYWFTWQTPVFDGRPGAFHCAEIPFVFANSDKCDYWTGGGRRAKALSDKMADAWIQFARTGSPDHPGIPRWTPFTTAACPTMIFDDDVRLALAPDGAEQAIIEGA